MDNGDHVRKLATDLEVGLPFVRGVIVKQDVARAVRYLRAYADVLDKIPASELESWGITPSSQ